MSSPDFTALYSDGMQNFQLFLHTNVADYIQQSIASFEAALLAAPDSNDVKAACLSQLGGAYCVRFDALGDAKDMDNSVSSLRRAIELVSPEYPGRAGILNNLANVLNQRFARFGNVEDSDAAIAAQVDAVAAAPNEQARAMFLANLALDLQDRFKRTSQIDDLNNSLEYIQEAIRLTPDGHPSIAARTAIFADALMLVHMITDSVEALDTAMENLRTSLDYTPPNHIGAATRLANLGMALLNRFDRLKETTDIDESIEVLEQAISITPDGNSEKGCTYVNLAIAFWTRYKHSKERDDIGSAIEMSRNGIKLLPDGHVFEAGGYNMLGAALMERAQYFDSIEDLNEAIEALYNATSRSSHAVSGYGHSVCLGNLATGLERRYDLRNDVKDLDEAIRLQREAASAVPEGQSNKVPLMLRLCDLTSKHLGVKGKASGEEVDTLLRTYLDIACTTSGTPEHRLAAVQSCLVLADAIMPLWHSCLHVCETLMDIIPRLIWIGAKLHRRLEDLQELKASVERAVTTGITFGRFDLAVEWFEHGRCIIWGQVLQTRTPFDEIRAAAPELAQELQDVSARLANASEGTTETQSLLSMTSPIRRQSGQIEGPESMRHDAARYERLIADARKLPGFENFLKPLPIDALRKAASSGPVILLNLTKKHCDALVLSQAGDDIIHVRLPKINEARAAKMHQIIRDELAKQGVRARGSAHSVASEENVRPIRTVLSLLWHCLVQPLFEAIEHVLFAAAEEEIPHVTWCPTASLTFLPIHAAGVYDPQDPAQPKIFDFVVSSYTPNLSALIAANQRHKTVDHSHPIVLAVSQPSTPGQQPLPGTLTEVGAIKRCVESVTHLDGEAATCKAVLEGMRNAEWTHFACHAEQDAFDPVRSAFVLHDGRLELADIMRESFARTELAVLSACQTATGDESVPNEAIHLTASMLMAGYRSVIGTMWSIYDADAPVVSEEFYSELLRTSSRRDGVLRTAYALHYATEKLRERVGQNSFMHWASFIHVGVGM